MIQTDKKLRGCRRDCDIYDHYRASDWWISIPATEDMLQSPSATDRPISNCLFPNSKYAVGIQLFPIHSAIQDAKAASYRMRGRIGYSCTSSSRRRWSRVCTPENPLSTGPGIRECACSPADANSRYISVLSRLKDAPPSILKCQDYASSSPSMERPTPPVARSMHLPVRPVLL